ncbi:MAG: hypothetical protein AMXMBFR33_07910 [Candidatus Xenobia bacterium]|jgi:hypothetical protein
MDGNAVLLQQAVRGENRQTFMQSLANQKAIKWVTVVKGQAAGGERSALEQW